jgi:heme-degrading monooxygenase HmoA
MSKYLAQINITRLLYPQGDPRVAGFFDNLDSVNAAAERMPGFVWRLKDESGNATAISVYDDPRLIVNMSVWDSAGSFEKFVWQTVHAAIYRRKSSWFAAMDAPHFAMWWIEADETPTALEGRRRLEHLQQNGPSDFAFGWESLPSAQLWRTQRCA